MCILKIERKMDQFQKYLEGCLTIRRMIDYRGYGVMTSRKEAMAILRLTIIWANERMDMIVTEIK